MQSRIEYGRKLTMLQSDPALTDLDVYMPFLMVQELHFKGEFSLYKKYQNLREPLITRGSQFFGGKMKQSSEKWAVVALAGHPRALQALNALRRMLEQSPLYASSVVCLHADGGEVPFTLDAHGATRERTFILVDVPTVGKGQFQVMETAHANLLSLDPSAAYCIAVGPRNGATISAARHLLTDFVRHGDKRLNSGKFPWGAR